MQRANKSSDARPTITLLFLIVFFLALPSLSWALDQGKVDGAGVIDSITFDGKRITAQGWAAPEQASLQITAVNILLGGTPIYSGPFERLDRPDVAISYNRSQWRASGWRVSFDLPDEIEPGISPVTATARTTTGESITLVSSPAAAKLVITQPRAEKSLIRNIKVILACAVILLMGCFTKATKLTAWINEKFNTHLSEPLFFSGCVMLVSFALVGLGLTGSSLGLGQPNAPFLKMDVTAITGHNQPVRSDEWLVLTPLSIAQYKHAPKNPIINKNLGEDGQNMLIVGMTGAPVAHLSEIAKPATWGFFVFDLKRALSWNWCFSIVGCFVALAFVLNRLSPEHWKHGFLFSALFCSAPYVVAWSNWPAYTVFFPCVIFLSALQILNTKSYYKLGALAFVLGLSLSGFVLVLYPAWQVSIGYVFLAATLGVLIQEKSYKNITPTRLVAYLVALLFSALIIGLWWNDAKTAIQTMEQTVYPGQRMAVGGTVSLSLLLRGFTNMATLQQLNSPLSNQSEIASFYYLLLPLAALFLVRLLQGVLTTLEWALAVIIAFIIFYMFVGLPLEWAKYSLWGRVPASRADLALGLSNLMITHLLLTRKHQSAKPSRLLQAVAASASVFWVYIVYRSLRQMDETFLAGLNSSIITAILLVTAATSYYLVTNKFKPFMYLSLGLSLATTASFHPINIAPRELSMRLPNDGNYKVISNTRALVLENTITAMFLAASGVPVANGIFYYPQKTLWKRLDPEGKEIDIYNRYQHLTFVGNTTVPNTYVLGTPRADVVTVAVHLKLFDFRQSGALVIFAPDRDKPNLDENPTLSFVASIDGWSWYALKAP